MLEKAEKENAKTNNVDKVEYGKIQVYSKGTISVKNVVQIGHEGCCKERMEGEEILPGAHVIMIVGLQAARRSFVATRRSMDQPE